MRRMIVFTALVASTFLLAACDNTIRGVGRDLNETGQAAHDAIN